MRLDGAHSTPAQFGDLASIEMQRGVRAAPGASCSLIQISRLGIFGRSRTQLASISRLGQGFDAAGTIGSIFNGSAKGTDCGSLHSVSLHSWNSIVPASL